MQFTDQIKTLYYKIQESDAIVIGAASGMSAAAGYLHWYQNDDFFYKNFQDFYDKYKFTGTFNGFYHPYKSEEERWAFLGRLNYVLYESPITETYKNLIDIIRNKTYHVLTTNQDFLFSKIIPEEKISAIQGDWRYYQCGKPCHDKLYDSKELAYTINAAIHDTKIPSDLVPRCPKCNTVMEPWVRSFVFLEGEKYYEEHHKLRRFLNEHQHQKILFLELGVGRMTPMFIQEPFWNLTYNLPNAFYISINPQHAIVPQEIAHKGLAIHDDIDKILKEVIQYGNEKSC